MRGAAARNHRNKEARDREAQREKERADTGKRKGRIERDDGIAIRVAILEAANVITLFDRFKVSNTRSSGSHRQRQRHKADSDLTPNSRAPPNLQSLTQKNRATPSTQKPDRKKSIHKRQRSTFSQ